jgi:maltooligosyltrehalose trehalohydrolase
MISMLSHRRHSPIGAEIVKNQGVHFRVWAPAAHSVEVVLEGKTAYFLEKEEEGYFSGLIAEAAAFTLYQLRLNQNPTLYPDPASRFQPQGPHGPSQVIDPTTYSWKDQHWLGVPSERRVIYEMHIGTFTPQGTFASAERELLELVDLGITILEIMPINEFPGKFGWGYDGVNLFAPTHLYGSPDEVRHFVDHAHALGLSVILDVVYNHFGPDGNHMRAFSSHYFSMKHFTEWGEAINFDGPDSKPVREFYLTNARYWIEEFHFDGLRLDATQNIYDDSSPHILAEISQTVRQVAAPRLIYLMSENELQETKMVHSIEEGGYGLDALWNDDFHHTAHTRLTGHNEFYYKDYLGTPQEFISSIKYGYLYQGQWYLLKAKQRGSSSLHLPPTAFINFIQNHDQIANTAHGLRIQKLTDPGNYRTMTALLLLAPGTPMLFQGQEFAASTPFYYFADHVSELSKLVYRGRREYFKYFPSIADTQIQANIPEPQALTTFRDCKLKFAERTLHAENYHLHRDLLKLRHHDPVFSQSRINGVDGAVIGSDAFILRYFGEEDTRLVIINFGIDLLLSPAPEPLLAAPAGTQWKILWSSEDLRYGGGGIPPLTTNQTWRIYGHSALVLIPIYQESQQL